MRSSSGGFLLPGSEGAADPLLPAASLLHTASIFIWSLFRGHGAVNEHCRLPLCDPAETQTQRRETQLVRRGQHVIHRNSLKNISRGGKYWSTNTSLLHLSTCFWYQYFTPLRLFTLTSYMLNTNTCTFYFLHFEPKYLYFLLITF